MTLAPASMMAAISDRYGSPDVLQFGSVPVPTVTADDVLVKVSYATVNRTDCGFLTAKPFLVRFVGGLLRPKFPILGCEFSGVVTAVGANVNRFSPGDRVFGFKDDDYGFGAHAEYTVMPQQGLILPAPDHLSDRELAAALEGSHYAMYGIRATGIDSTKRVLVNGATGAIGSAAVQIIAAMNAEVTAVCDAKHADTVRGLGASHIIDYTTEDFTQSDKRFDVVYDAVGKSRYAHSRRVLTKYGCYVSTELGPMVQNPFLALRPKWLTKQAVHFPIPTNNVSDRDFIADLLQSGKFKPLIDKEYKFSEIVEAYRYVLSGKKIGNVLLNLSH